MCASLALPKLLLVLSEPGRLCKVHLEFLHLCSDYPRLSRQSYTWTQKKKSNLSLRMNYALGVEHISNFFLPHNSLLSLYLCFFFGLPCPFLFILKITLCFQSLFSYSVLALTAHREKKYCHKHLKQESIGQRKTLESANTQYIVNCTVYVFTIDVLPFFWYEWIMCSWVWMCACFCGSLFFW